MENSISEVPVNQKDYLKKYLGIGKAPGEKKKKKKKNVLNSRVQIIDDDADANNPTVTIEEDILTMNEDAPQIVAIIDERPPSLRIDEKTKNPLWQPIGTVEDLTSNEPKQLIKGFKIANKTNEPALLEFSKNKTKKKSDNISPKSKNKKEELTVTIKEERRSESPSRKKEEDRHVLPTTIKHEKIGDAGSNSPSTKTRIIHDASPPTIVRRDDDISPVRQHKHDDDPSPPRRRKENDDISPPRRSRNDILLPRSVEKRHQNPSTIIKNRSSKFEDNSFDRKNKKSLDCSPKRKSRFDDVSSRKRKDEANTSQNMNKTLDGKTAGLQNAQKLVEEMKKFNSRENNLFNSLGKEISGEKAETIFRDKKSGRIRNLEEEEEKQRNKYEQEVKNKEKYERWGRGLAQVESREQRINEELHEMSKPLARYADDEDLEKYLKEQEREGDPMLDYIRRKKRKKAIERGETIKPQFEGEFMPNRYGIRPGHRWDGVDRSNGYEKKWFEVQNSKKAQLEDSYKWSTEDM